MVGLLIFDELPESLHTGKNASVFFLRCNDLVKVVPVCIAEVPLDFRFQSPELELLGRSASLLTFLKRFVTPLNLPLQVQVDPGEVFPGPGLSMGNVLFDAGLHPCLEHSPESFS